MSHATPDEQSTALPTRWDALLMPVIFALALALSVFQLWQGVTGSLSATYLRPVHLCWVLILIFIRYPMFKNPSVAGYNLGRIIDIGLALLALYAGIITLSFDYKSIDHLLHGLNTADYLGGVIFLLLVLEATRRSVGWEMALIGCVFLLFCAFGNYLPDAVANRGFSLERIVRFQVFTTEGIFGIPLGIAATAVFIFVLFGAFLETTGAGKFFIDLSFAAAGKYRGGPAKACVVSSAAMGSISGSAIANAVAVGALTIPMMKKLGYKPHEAAGIEAAASTGGQIMPPIMGAGAFIMAEFTNIPYSTIVLVSIAPAILYFACTLLYVHLMACKAGLEGMTERPKVVDIMKYGAHFLLPLGLITVLLLMNFSPTLVGAIGCAAIVLSSLLRKHTRSSWKVIVGGMKAGALMALPISAACATAGIVVGVIGQTGIGLQFTEFVMSLSGGQLWLALLLVALAALVLGMGLPVTAAYIILSVMAAPALETLGVPLLVAHMLIFWLSQVSNITPPVALAAFAAAGVAGASPLKSSIEAMKLAQGYFIIPLMMVYTNLIYAGDVTFWQYLWAVVQTITVIIAFACAIEGYALMRCNLVERLLFASAIPLILWYEQISNVVGIALVAAALTLNWLRWKQGKAASAIVVQGEN